MPALWMAVAAVTAAPVAGAGVIGVLCCAGTRGAPGGRGGWSAWIAALVRPLVHWGNGVLQCPGCLTGEACVPPQPRASIIRINASISSNAKSRWKDNDYQMSEQLECNSVSAGGVCSVSSAFKSKVCSVVKWFVWSEKLWSFRQLSNQLIQLLICQDSNFPMSPEEKSAQQLVSAS